MPKLKTHKSVTKRIKVTSGKKLKVTTGGKDHFNSRESGKVTRNKRRDTSLSSSNKKNIKRLLPYS